MGLGNLPTFTSGRYLAFEFSLKSLPGSRQPPPAEQCPMRKLICEIVLLESGRGPCYNWHMV